MTELRHDLQLPPIALNDRLGVELSHSATAIRMAAYVQVFGRRP
jgi:hypothetical protein